MSGLGRYPLNIPSLSDAFLGSNQRRDRLDYDDRRYRERERDRRDDDYRRDSSGSRGRSSRDRYSPEPSYSSYLDDPRDDLVSYPLGHLSSSRTERGGGNRSDRNRNQNNRDRYRNNNNNNRSQGNRGPSNQGPGILGAKPGDRSVPDLPTNPLQVPALGVTGGGLGSGLTAQLAQQQQQLMAMVQTQSLLAAMQAQANANAQAQVRAKQAMPSSMGLLPTPLIPRNQTRDIQRQNRKRGRNDNWGRGGNYGNKRERLDNNRRQQQGGGQNQQNRGRQNQQSQQAKKTTAPEQKDDKKEEAVEEEVQDDEEEETAQDGNETEELNSTQEDKQDHKEVSKPVEFNDRPLPKAVNFVGEDVDALMISLFDKKRSKYICQTCKIICNIPTSFHKHLLGKRHAKTVLEKQGKELDVEAFKNFSQEIAPTKKSETEGIVSPTKAGEKEKVAAPALSSPSRVQSPGAETSLDFVKYTCDTRKTALKDGNIITISSVTQSRVRIEGFTSGRNMLGCEFVKAVSGFNCRLCKTFIRCGNDVINHIKGKKHQNNYKSYIQEHPQYEEHQLARNKELEAVLEPREGEEVMLYEVLDKDIKSTASKPRSRRKDSQTDESEEVQITKFVIAPQSSDVADQIHVDAAADLDESMESMDHVNEDSLIADDSIDEQRGALTTTEEEDLLYDPAEDTAFYESQDDQQLTAAQPEVSEDFIPLVVDEPGKTEEQEEPDVPVSPTPRLASNQWKEQETDTPESSQEDTEDSSPKVTPTARRGRKGAKGGAGGAARGRGRGRGARRSARTAAGAGRAGKAKKEKADEVTDINDDVNLMEGFEIIDEIGDGED